MLINGFKKYDLIFVVLLSILLNSCLSTESSTKTKAYPVTSRKDSPVSEKQKAAPQKDPAVSEKSSVKSKEVDKDKIRQAWSGQIAQENKPAEKRTAEPAEKTDTGSGVNEDEIRQAWSGRIAQIKEPEKGSAAPENKPEKSGGSEKGKISQAWSSQIAQANKPEKKATEPETGPDKRKGVNEDEIRQAWSGRLSKVKKPETSSVKPENKSEKKSGSDRDKISQAWSGQIAQANKSEKGTIHSKKDADKSTGLDKDGIHQAWSSQISQAKKPEDKKSTGKSGESIPLKYQAEFSKESDEKVAENKAKDTFRPRNGRYFALIIGINNYPHFQNLDCAINDAIAVANLLEQHYGFEVNLLKDAERKDIIIALNEYREKLSKDDKFLIYYAGHGWYDKEADAGYWLPSDADNDNEVQWISHAYVTAILRAIEARHVMIIADSCYSGKLTRSIRVVRKSPSYYNAIAKKRQEWY